MAGNVLPLVLHITECKTLQYYIYTRAAGKTSKTAVLPGFSAGKTWSYLDVQKKAEVLSRKGNKLFPYYFCDTMKEVIAFVFNAIIKSKAVNQYKKKFFLKILIFFPYLIESFEKSHAKCGIS